jgi:hypothetical protein
MAGVAVTVGVAISFAVGIQPRKFLVSVAVVTAGAVMTASSMTSSLLLIG